MDESEIIRKNANSVANELDAAIVAYTGHIDYAGVSKVFQVLRGKDKPNRGSTFLMLRTLGGDPHEAYRLARMLQVMSSKEFHVYVPDVCKSAGTLAALGASRIFMSVHGEMGPIDTQTQRAGGMGGGLRSGLVVQAALQGLASQAMESYNDIVRHIQHNSNVSYDVASQAAASLVAGILSPVSSQIDPETLGEDLRGIRIAKYYGTRLTEWHNNARENAVKRLVEHYPTHRFIIDVHEARSLFNYVHPPSPEMYELYYKFPDHDRLSANQPLVERLDDAGLDESQQEKKAQAVSGDASNVSTGADASGVSLE